MITSLETISKKISSLYQAHPHRIDLEKEEEKIKKEEREEVSQTFSQTLFPQSGGEKKPNSSTLLVDLTKIDDPDQMVLLIEQTQARLAQIRSQREILEKTINFRSLHEAHLLDAQFILPFILEKKKLLEEEKIRNGAKIEDRQEKGPEGDTVKE
jgi:hypothetical protein